MVVHPAGYMRSCGCVEEKLCINLHICVLVFFIDLISFITLFCHNKFISFFHNIYIKWRIFPVGVDRVYVFLHATILTHFFHFIHFQKRCHTCLPVKPKLLLTRPFFIKPLTLPARPITRDYSAKYKLIWLILLMFD